MRLKIIFEGIYYYSSHMSPIKGTIRQLTEEGFSFKTQNVCILRCLHLSSKKDIMSYSQHQLPSHLWDG